MKPAITLSWSLWCVVSLAVGRCTACVPVQDVCGDATAVIGRSADKATCEVTVHFNVLVASAPEVPSPGRILGLLGRSISVEVPLSFKGTLPVSYQAQPAPGCQGNGEAKQCTTKCVFPKGKSQHGGAHLMGFDGSHLEFQGVKGEFYNLVSDPDHILNARLVKHGKRLGSDGVKWIDPPHLAQDANWMDTLGLTYKDDTVEIQNSADGKAKVLINNKPMDQADGLRTLPSNMTVEHGITQVIDGSLWGVSGAWALPMVTINTSRYLLEVAIPSNYQKRLDLTARLTARKNGTLPAQEGILGRTIEPLVGPLAPTREGEPQKGRRDIQKEWAEEAEMIKKSPSVEARLRRNYRVTNLFAKDSGRSAHEQLYKDVVFAAHATDRLKVSLQMGPDQILQTEDFITTTRRQMQDAGLTSADPDDDVNRFIHVGGLMCY